jgi:hypothetical protein
MFQSLRGMHVLHVILLLFFLLLGFATQLSVDAATHKHSIVEPARSALSSTFSAGQNFDIDWVEIERIQ